MTVSLESIVSKCEWGGELADKSVKIIANCGQLALLLAPHRYCQWMAKAGVLREVLSAISCVVDLPKARHLADPEKNRAGIAFLITLRLSMLAYSTGRFVKVAPVATGALPVVCSSVLALNVLGLREVWKAKEKSLKDYLMAGDCLTDVVSTVAQLIPGGGLLASSAGVASGSFAMASLLLQKNIEDDS